MGFSKIKKVKNLVYERKKNCSDFDEIFFSDMIQDSKTKKNKIFFHQNLFLIFLLEGLHLLIDRKKNPYRLLTGKKNQKVFTFEREGGCCISLTRTEPKVILKEGSDIFNVEDSYADSLVTKKKIW